MQIARVVIEHFRRIERLDLSFTDSLDRVRDVTLLVGPNGSGKTTVLDAIAAAIGPTTELPAARVGFELTPPRIVRRGALSAKVTCVLRFSPDEIAATRELFRFAEEQREVPDVRDVELTWTYPDPQGKFKLGYTRTEPANAWTLLKARVYVARLLRTGKVDWSWFKRAGQVVTFDQQRTSLARTVRRDIWEIIQGGRADDEGDVRRTSDLRTILLDMAVRSQFPQRGAQGTDDPFEQVKRRYAEICAPRRILGAVRDELGTLDVQFTDGTLDYGFDGLSSGEAMVVLFLTKMVSDRIHRSIVLADEVELHQHPVWQRRLLHLLPKMGEENQIIATTHSSYLRDVVSKAAVLDVTRMMGPPKPPPSSGDDDAAPQVIALGDLDEGQARA